MEEQLLAEINRIYGVMQRMDPDEDEYQALMNRYMKLFELHLESIKTETEVAKADNEAYKMKVELEKIKRQNEPNVNDLIGAATNIAGILAILHHEKLNVISTKALGFVKKLKF